MGPKFSLQAVLDYRHSRVESLEMELARLQEALQQGLAMQAQTQDWIVQLYQQLEEAQNGELDLFAIQHLREDLQNAQNKLDQINTAIKLLEERLEGKRLEIVTAKQAEETLNTLKQKEQNRWLAERAAAENRQQDDTYISQAFRKGNGSMNV